MKKKILWSILGLIAVLLVAGFALGERDIPASQLESRYTNAASRFVQLSSGARVHVRDEGNPSGQVLVLIHGSNSSLQTWEPWVQRLGNTFRMVSLDLPGHGLTGPNPSGDYSMKAMVELVEELAQAMKLVRFDLAGSSFGGQIAWHYALAHPDRVRRMILVDAAGYASEAHPPLVFRLAQTPVLRNVLLWLTPKSLVRSTLRDAFYDAKRITPEMVDRYHDLRLREGNRRAGLAISAAIRHEDPDSPLIQNIGPTTLVLWGAQDRIIPVSAAQRFHDDLKGSVLRVYGHVGHLPMEELPDETANEVRVFLTMANPW